MSQSSSQSGTRDCCSGQLPLTWPMQHNEASRKEISLPKCTGSSEEKGQPQHSAAAGSWIFLYFITAWNYTHCYSRMPSDSDSWGIQEHRQSHLAQGIKWNRQGQSRGWGSVTGHIPGGTEGFPHNFSQVNCTKRNKQVKEAKQYFIDSHKTDMDCIQP